MDSLSFIENDGIPEFAHGLKILLFDPDQNSLMYTASVLEQYSFNVTAVENASLALSLFSEQKDHYGLVMASISKSDIDSVYFLLKLLEKEIPVILISSEMNAEITRIALDKGATFFHKKPIPLVDLKNVWRHAYWKTNAMKDTGKLTCDYQDIATNEDSGVLRPSFGGIEAMEDGPLCIPDIWNDWTDFGLETDLEDLDGCSFEDLFPTESQEKKASGRNQLADDTDKQGKEKKLKRTVDPNESDSIARNQDKSSKKQSDDGTDKKKRISWTAYLHNKFTAAIIALGDQKARPKAIKNKMNVKDVTMRQVASHLQKFKKQIKRIDEKAVVTGRTSLEEYTRRNELVRATQSSLVCQRIPVGGKPTGSAAPNPLTRSSLSVPGLNYQDYRLQNLNSRHQGLSHYRYLDADFPSGSRRTNGRFQNTDQIPETRKFANKAEMKNILKRKRPLGLEESNLKVTENIPSMAYMTSEVDSVNMSINTVQLPNEPPALHQGQYGSTAIGGKRKVLELQKMNPPSIRYLNPEAESPYLSANAAQFSSEVSVVTQEKTCTPVVSEPMNSETWDKFSTEDQPSVIDELMPISLPSMDYMTPDTASVNFEQYYASAYFSSLETRNNFSTEIGGTDEGLEFLLDSPSMECVTDEDASPLKSVNTFPFSNLEKYCTLSSTQDLENLPVYFNSGSQELDASTGDTPPTTSSYERQQPVYADLSEMLEADLDEGDAPYAGSVDDYCKMLEMQIVGRVDPQVEDS